MGGAEANACYSGVKLLRRGPLDSTGISSSVGPGGDWHSVIALVQDDEPPYVVSRDADPVSNDVRSRCLRFLPDTTVPNSETGETVPLQVFPPGDPQLTPLPTVKCLHICPIHNRVCVPAVFVTAYLVLLRDRTLKHVGEIMEALTISR